RTCERMAAPGHSSSRATASLAAVHCGCHRNPRRFHAGRVVRRPYGRPRNSFAVADQQMLATLRLPLLIKGQLALEDPRYADLQRNVLSKLERAMPSVSISLTTVRHYPTTGSG